MKAATPLFANQHLAWQTLPDALKRTVQNMRAEHSNLAKFEQLRARNPWRLALKPEQIAEVKPVQHPIMRTCPETGQKALFVSKHFTTRIVACPMTKAGHCYRRCSSTACARRWCIGIVGSCMTWCSGTTARSCILPPARPTTCAAGSTVSPSKAIRLSRQLFQPTGAATRQIFQKSRSWRLEPADLRESS